MPSYEPTYTEEYKNLTIKIYQDMDAPNPWTDTDGNPPIAVLTFDYGRSSITEYGEKNGHANAVPTLTAAQIQAHKTETLNLIGETLPYICEMFGADADGLFRNIMFDPGIASEMNEAIRQHVDDLGNSHRLEALETLFNIAGIPALLKTVRGYSQGDWAEVLAISTPQFEEEIGTKWTREELKGSIQLYQDWAFGNVYGYVVEDQNGKHLDSCWGFFGDYDAPYSALSEAKSYIDWYAENQKREHFAQIKAWIRNRVPYQYRHFVV